jgi:hypothetical protein
MALVVSPDGSYSEITLVSGPGVDEQVRDIVGGWFEVIGLGDGLYMVYAEHGVRRDFPRNEEATLLARDALSSGEYIAGIAIVVSRSELGI